MDIIIYRSSFRLYHAMAVKRYMSLKLIFQEDTNMINKDLVANDTISTDNLATQEAGQGID